jgi:hypothetical protein
VAACRRPVSRSLAHCKAGCQHTSPPTEHVCLPASKICPCTYTTPPPLTQVDNGVPIESWYDDDSDEELLRVLPFLESLVDVEDVRPLIQQRFRMRELIEKAC